MIRKRLAAIAAVVIGAGGLSAAAVALPASGAAGTLYGCVVPVTRTIVEVHSVPITCQPGQRPVTFVGNLGQPVPTPSPSATTPTPTPTPTVTSTSPSASPSTGTACVTSATNGSCGPYTYSGITTSNGFNTYVANNIWNDINDVQTLTAYSPGNWSISANATGTAVQSYTETSQLYTTASNTPDPLSSFASINSTFVDSGVGNPGDYEWAYDIWEGTGTNNYAQEIMIWTDNHGQVPAGTDLGAVTIGSATYELWSTGGTGAVGNPVTLVETTAEQSASGSVDILAVLNYLVANGYSPAGSGLNQIDYGPEVCSTTGVPETFGVSGFTITTS